MSSSFFLKPDLELVHDRHVDIIIGGPPCQPFSVVGSQRGKHDDRDGFPAFLSAMRQYEPKLAIFENVRGMLYRNRGYFELIRTEMRDLGYAVSWRLLNAVDFRVPQNRERLVVVAHRKEWKFPAPGNAHGQVTVGQALAGLVIPKGEPFRFLTESMDKYVATYEAKSKCINPRDLNMERPSRTVTCRNLAAATADMLRIKMPDGRRRMLTEREGARLPELSRLVHLQRPGSQEIRADWQCRGTPVRKGNRQSCTGRPLTPRPTERSDPPVE